MAESYKRSRDDSYASPDAKRQNLGVETVYRLLVPARKVGSVIGKGGQIVKNIREETSSKIRVCEGVPSCDDRVIVIAARDDDPSVEENNAQVALMRVHERLVESDDAPNAHGLVTRMLVCHTQAGCIIGKSGKIIKEIRETSGATIKILTEAELPLCALHNDRVVQIMGDTNALVRALRLVSKQIRDNPSKERPGGATPALLAMVQGAPAPGAPQQWAGAPSGGAGYRPQYQR